MPLPQQQLALLPIQLCREPSLARPFRDLEGLVPELWHISRGRVSAG